MVWFIHFEPCIGILAVVLLSPSQADAYALGARQRAGVAHQDVRLVTSLRGAGNIGGRRSSTDARFTSETASQQELLLESVFPWPHLLDLFRRSDAENSSQLRLSILQEEGKPAPANSTEYSALWKDVKRNLTFIHIPRAGGSAVESVRFSEEKKGPAPVPMWGVHDTAHQHGLARINGATNAASCYRQHHPPNLNPSAFADSDTFCVMRDPVKRMISQFGFAHSFYGEGYCDNKSLNTYLAKALQEYKHNPYLQDCHFLPQSAYVLGWDAAAGHADKKGRACTHVLAYDTIALDFNRLMETYGYPLRLDVTKKSGFQSPKGCDALAPDGLEPAVLNTIKRMYKDDYDLLNTMVHEIGGR